MECSSDGDCNDGDPCTHDRCEPGIGCFHEDVDADGDGYLAAEVDGVSCGGTDCDDAHDDAYPGGTEVCLDGIDQDCDGLVDGPMPMIEDVRVSDGFYPSMAWAGDAYGIVWRDDRDGNDEIYFARLSPEGSRLGDDMRLSDFEGWSSHPDIVWSGSTYGIAWHDGRTGNLQVFYSLISSTGGRMITDRWLTSIPSDSLYPALGWTGDEFGVVWRDDRFEGDPEILFQRIQADGTIPYGGPARTTVSPGDSSYPSIAWTGSEFGILWQDDRDGGDPEIYFTRIDQVGTERGDDVRVTSEDGTSRTFIRSLAWTGSEYGLAWADERDGDKEIYFTHLTADAEKIGEDVRITESTGESSSASLVWTGSEFLVCWDDDREDNAEIWVTRISAEGDKVGTDTRVTNAEGNSLNPIVEWSGSLAGVVWHDLRDGGMDPGAVYFTLLGFCD